MLHRVLKEKIIDYSDNVGYNGVYLLYHINKPDIVYIGSTNRVYSKKKCKNGCYGRWIEHYHRLRKNIHNSLYLQNVINKYGLDGVRFKILETTDVNVRVREKFYIDKYNSFNNGYNLSNETKYVTMSDENRLKSSVRMKNNNPMKNKKTLKKQLNTRKELYPPLRVLQYDVEGNFIKEWVSIDNICEELNVDFSNINRNINGKTKTSIGYLWFYKLNFTKKLLNERVDKFNIKYRATQDTINKIIKSNNVKISQYSLDNEFMREFDSIKEAGVIIGVHPSNITRCCNGKSKTCQGFIWKKN